MKSFEFPSAARNATLYRKVYSKTDDHLLFASSIRLHVGDVGQMIGWLNLRSVAGGSGGVPTRLTTPDWPAEAHEPGTVVFVHGYNMEEDDDEPEDEPHYEPDPDEPEPHRDIYDGATGHDPENCDCCGFCRLNGKNGCGHHAFGPPDSETGTTCPLHNCPYDECSELHGDDAPYTAWFPNSTEVLKIGRAVSTNAIALTVPEGAVNCCPCPDHRTNWVGVAYKSGHVAVKGTDGRSLGLTKDWIYDCAIVQMCNCANEEMGIC